MTTYYLDPEGGNDANTGTSFAQRRKTLTAITAANLVAGDTIRYIASRDPNSTGVNATWTNGSKTVTLASALTATIDNGEVTTGWTASSNVSVVNSTTATRKRSGNSTGVARFDVAAGFTTGKIAYKAVSPGDLSAYQQIACWFWSSGNNVAGALELRLCSDTTGDTPVYTVPLTEQTLAGNYKMVVKDFAAALSTTIQSISLYANTDPGAVSLQIQNIIACKAANGTDTLTPLSLIKPAGGSEWYPINAIDGTTISLGGATAADYNSTNATPRNYTGSTVTSALWKLQPIDGVNAGGTSPPFASANRSLQDNGTVAAEITVSGGWNRTDMSTQTGETWLSGAHFAGAAFNSGALDYITWTNFGFAHFTADPITFSSGCNGLTIDLLGIVACSGGIQVIGCGEWCNVDVDYINSCEGFPLYMASQTTGDYTVNIGKLLNTTGATSAAQCYLGSGEGYIGRVRIPVIDGAQSNAFQLQSNSGKIIVSDVVQTNGGSGLFVQGTASGNDVTFVNCLPYTATTVSATAVTTDGRRIMAHNDGQAAGAHWTMGYYFSFQSQTTTRHTASGYAWKLSCGHATNRSAKRPIEVPISHYYATANQAITIKCWMQRSSTSLACGIRVKGGSALGIPSDVSGAMTAAINTWEEVSLTVTPTIDGCIEIFGYAYGAVADCYFDDLSVNT